MTNKEMATYCQQDKLLQMKRKETNDKVNQLFMNSGALLIVQLISTISFDQLYSLIKPYTNSIRDASYFYKYSIKYIAYQINGGLTIAVNTNNGYMYKAVSEKQVRKMLYHLLYDKLII